MNQEIRGTKNLGLIQAIYSGITPPLNIKIIWYDDNLGQKIHKYYDVTTSTWIPFGGNGPVTINGHFVYIAYASNCQDADFSLIFNSAIHKYFAIVSSPTEISVGALIPSLFSKRWTKFCDGATGGNYTYVGYADDCDGSNFSLFPSYEVPCDDCKWVDKFTELIVKGQISHSIVPNGIQIDFHDVMNGEYIELDLTMLELPLDNLTEYSFQITQDESFESLDANNCSILIDTNDSTPYLYTNNPYGVESFIKVINSSKIGIHVSPLNQNNFSGSIVIKIGTKGCAEEGGGEPCYACRKYMAILTSDTAISPLEPSHFQGYWIPMASCGCGCDEGGSESADIKSLSQQFTVLMNKYIEDFNTLSNTISLQNDEIISLNLLIDSNKDEVNSQFSAIDDIISQNQNTTNTEIQNLQSSIGNLNLRVTEIEDNFDADSISTKIQSNISVMMTDFKANVLDDEFSDLNSRVSQLETDSSDFEVRITDLENNGLI